MHHNSHWEQESSHLPSCPLSVQLSFRSSSFLLSEMYDIVLSMPFKNNIFFFLNSHRLLVSAVSTVLFRLWFVDSCFPLLLQELLAFLEISYISTAEKAPKASRARCSGLVIMFFWAEERSSVAIIQLEWTTEAVIVMWFVVRR